MALPQRSLLILALVMAAGLACPLLRSAAAPGNSYRATVVSIGDGDTLRVQTNGQGQAQRQAQTRAEGHVITIRLACIDAPETAQSPWGQQSRAYLIQRLPPGHQVSIRPHTTDRYGRTVAEVISSGNINLQMVADGQAFAYRRYLGGCDASEYLDAELRASRQRHGVWQLQGGIIRPWDFRRGRRGAAIADGTTPDGHRYRCREIGSHARAQELLRQGHTYLDGNGDGEACESLRH